MNCTARGWDKATSLSGCLRTLAEDGRIGKPLAIIKMNGRGSTGQFANLDCKYKHEIPISVLLPADGPVRKTITGTDVDGVREVSGIVAVHEVKGVDAQPISNGQLRAMRTLGDFFIGSRWIYADIENPPRTQEEIIAVQHGYKKNATPLSAVIWANKPISNKWLYRYLIDCGFAITCTNTNGYAIQFYMPENSIGTHIFRPTAQWLAIAYIPDYYYLFQEGNYCFPDTNFIDPALF